MVILSCGLYAAHLSAQVSPRSGFCYPYPYRPGTNTHFTRKETHNELLGHHLASQETRWNFAGGSKISIRTKLRKFMIEKARPNPAVCASSQIATTLFTLGTAIVLPLYTLMIIAPKQKMTKKTMESQVPYVALGLIYAYALGLSWTPQHIGALFGGNSMMPDFSRVGVLFFSELSSTAAWIHLLLMDLFCARQVFLDGLENEVETRHSITLCLFFCPLGLVSHAITKALTRMSQTPPGNL